MIYQKFKPSIHLTPYVECYYLWESQVYLSAPLQVESPPTGYTSLIFNYGDPYRVINEKYKDVPTPATFLSGQATKSYRLQLSGQIGIVGVVMKPSAIHTLFGIPMYEMSDERIAMEDVLGKEALYLHEQILEAGTAAGRIQTIEQFLLRKLSQPKGAFDRTDYVANLIMEKRGVLPIRDLMDELYVCQRQFQRHFLKKVGVSPKYYARISRISKLCALMAQKQWKIQDWHELIATYGYYDQSHFIKEFTEFTGKSPSLYIKGNSELANYL
ncbi:helix-turn-helix transcriptional regulator [Telluribacter humicola]|uniref:helix-turn-helix transcriptional regulator n=1 Tax=Telluribacter humicola TaxID=1720261 RepID=UPI001A97509C|nr:helix-turn-helix transcriptional regulator [Telluribacter humicola]